MTTAPPSDLGPAGAALYASLAGEFDLAEHEHRLLLEAARTADLLDALHAVIAAEGPMGTDGKPHPAVVERRQQQLVLGRLLAGLRIPDEDDQRPQRRPLRGSYGPRIAS